MSRVSGVFLTILLGQVGENPGNEVVLCSQKSQIETVRNFLWSSILKDSIEVEEKKEEVLVLRSRPSQNVKIGIFTSQ